MKMSIKFMRKQTDQSSQELSVQVNLFGLSAISFFMRNVK